MQQMLYPDSPVFIFLEITTECNSYCRHCCNVFGRNGTHLTAAQVDCILSQMPQLDSVKVTGGEPTTNPHFFDIIETISRHGATFSVFSNGRWGDRKRKLEIINRLKRYKNFNGFLISFHGADARTHEYYTGVKGSFEDTIETVRLLSEHKMHFSTNTVLFERNAPQIGRIVKMAQLYHPSTISFNRYYGRLPMIKVETLRKAIRKIEMLRKSGLEIHFGNCTPQCFEPSSAYGCMAGISYCSISPTGDVRPCGFSSLVAGNIFKSDFNQIWHSEALRQWRAFVPTACQGCAKLGLCHGGCKALVKNLGLKQDPLFQRAIRQEEEQSAVLLESSVPYKTLSIRPQSFGAVIYGRNQCAMVSKEGLRILDAIDGQTDLGSLRKRFGSNSMRYLYRLHLKGFVEFGPRGMKGSDHGQVLLGQCIA